MNLIVIAALIALLICLSFVRIPLIFWVLIWLAAVWSFVRFGITPHVPASILLIYLGIAASGLLAYLIADEKRWREVCNQFTAFITQKRYTIALGLVTAALPLLLAGKIYKDMTRQVKAPTFGRTIHPAPPDEINFKGAKVHLSTADNPHRMLQTSDPAKFKEHVAAGKKIYYQNCVFCHGDDLRGDGMFAHALTPVPADFNSPTTIPNLTESYLFWRIAKGGPGLPEEAGPWDSSMPVWEKYLSQDDIWNVILFLYDHTGREPRAREEHH